MAGTSSTLTAQQMYTLWACGGGLVQKPRLAGCKQSHMLQGEGGCAASLLTEGSTVLKQMQRWSNSWEN